MYEGLRHAAELAREFEIPSDCTGRPRRVLRALARQLDELAESHAPADEGDRNYPSLSLTGNFRRDLQIINDWLTRLEEPEQQLLAVGLAVHLQARALERVRSSPESE